MTISLSDIGKRFNKRWLFQNISLSIESGQHFGIKGINGSGKSTLLQIIAGITLPTEGSVSYKKENDAELTVEKLAGKLMIVSPYMDLPEQMKLSELFHFHQKFIPFKEQVDFKGFCERTNLKDRESNYIKEFSSGMKQRLKLGLAFMGNTPLLLLDEPCSNLDLAGKELYRSLLAEYGSDRTVIIASNEEEVELKSCRQTINLMDYKKA